MRPRYQILRNATCIRLQLQIAIHSAGISPGHPQIRTQAKLQRRPPLQIHRKSGCFPGRSECIVSHLLDAASVLNFRWLYYTQEDANGMWRGGRWQWRGGGGRAWQRRVRRRVRRRGRRWRCHTSTRAHDVDGGAATHPHAPTTYTHTSTPRPVHRAAQLLLSCCQHPPALPKFFLCLK